LWGPFSRVPFFCEGNQDNQDNKVVVIDMAGQSTPDGNITTYMESQAGAGQFGD
jgi:hypothetical protein